MDMIEQAWLGFCQTIMDDCDNIKYTDKTVDALRALMAQVLDNDPDSELWTLVTYPSHAAVEMAGEGLSPSDIEEKALNGGWDPNKHELMRINEQGDWEGTTTGTADRRLYAHIEDIIAGVMEIVRSKGCTYEFTEIAANLVALNEEREEASYLGNRSLTVVELHDMVRKVDCMLLPQVRDLDEFPEAEPVYRIGDWGYVRTSVYAEAFEDAPEWARDMYMLDGNEPMLDRYWVASYNVGGMPAIGDLLNRQFELDRADNVYYTEA